MTSCLRGHLLGQRGRGYAQFLETSTKDVSRSLPSPSALPGLPRRVVELREGPPRVRSAHRQLPGDPVQDRRHGGADAYGATRLLRGCEQDAARRTVQAGAAIAKLYASEAAVTNAREATQIFGGYGFMNEFPVARHWRDAKVLEIGEGTSEVQRCSSPGRSPVSDRLPTVGVVGPDSSPA